MMGFMYFCFFSIFFPSCQRHVHSAEGREVERENVPNEARSLHNPLASIFILVGFGDTYAHAPGMFFKLSQPRPELRSFHAQLGVLPKD